jgi:replicative DNA helicase
MQRKGGLDLVIVDYVQLMAGTGQNRTQEIGSISRGLKALAKELEVPIVALAQLNRSLEGRTDRRPLLSDLRDSGEVEQDADIVVMLHREAMYGAGPEWHGLAEVLVRKHRNGPTGAVLMSFDEPTGGFGRYVGPNPRVAGKVGRAQNFDGGFKPPTSAPPRSYKDES